MSLDVDADDFQILLTCNKSNATMCLKESVAYLEMSSLPASSFSSKKKKKCKRKVLSSYRLIDSVDSSYTSLPRTVQENNIQSVTKDNLKTGVATTKSNKHICNSDVKDLSCIEDSDKKSHITTQLMKPEENEDDDIKPTSIMRKIGEEYDIVIENITSPSEFYVSIVDNQPYLLALEKKLKSIPQIKIKDLLTGTRKLEKDENKKVLISKKIGNYALFYSKDDETWYRVKVTNWCLNFLDDFVTVFLLDYGESKCVSVDYLQTMPNYFKKFPAITQRCHLHDVFPLEMNPSDKTLHWSKECIEKMKYLTEESKKLKIKVAGSDCFHPLTSIPVTLWLVDQGNKCVNELLVDSKCAIQGSALDQESMNLIKEVHDNTEEKILEDWNPMKEDYESYINFYDLDINDSAAVIYGYVGRDYDRICPYFLRNGYCVKGKACKKEHKVLNPLGFTTDQEEVFSRAYNTLPEPPVNSIINVQVTYILKFNQFCCIATDGSYSVKEGILSLLKCMNRAENVKEMKKLLIPPSVGQIVVARYSKDQCWYRARVLESQPEKDNFMVLYVDYGNKETLTLSDIRAIEAKYLHLPFQAMQCFIHGVDQNPQKPLKKILDYVSGRMGNGSIKIKVISKLPGEGINLMVHALDQNGRNIGDDMITKKYAIPKQEVLINVNSDSLPG